MEYGLTHYLHEEPRDESLPDVEVVVLAAELRAGPAKVEPVHDPRQLLSHVVSRAQGTRADKVVVAPLSVFAICKEGKGWGLRRYCLVPCDENHL